MIRLDRNEFEVYIAELLGVEAGTLAPNRVDQLWSEADATGYHLHKSNVAIPVIYEAV